MRRTCRDASALDEPRRPDTMVNLSTQRRNEKFRQAQVLHAKGDLAGAQEAYVAILTRHPDDVESLHHIGILNLQQGDPNLAIAFFDQALMRSPEDGQILAHRGVAWNALGRPDHALESFEAALAARPQDANIQFQSADALLDLGRLDEAIAGFTKVLDLDGQHLAARHNRAVSAQHLGRYEAALADYDTLLTISPQDVEARINRGVVLRRMGRPQEALDALESVVRLSDQHAGAYSNLGNVLQDLGRFDEAVAAFDRAISLNPQNPDALSNRGVALAELGRLDEAIDSYDRAIRLDPGAADAYSNRGLAYKALRRPTEALTDFETAITLNPNFAEAYSNKGNALQELKHFDLAIESYDRAISLRPDNADAHYNRGNALQELKQTAAARDAYATALWLDPAYGYLPGTLLHTSMQLADWTGGPEAIADLETGILHGRKVAPPFPVLALTDSPMAQKAAAETWIRDKVPQRRRLEAIGARPPGKKLRIGYFSADFHNHAMAYLMAELYEAHDRSQFELTGFSLGPDRDDDMRKRTSRAFDKFIDVRTLSDLEIAQTARSLEIDIAVDLNGFTQGARLGAFADGCAPIQINFLGYPGTLGAPYMDYIVADHVLIPEGSQKFYSEKVIYLPHSYQVNDSQREISDRVFSRAELGLPEAGFVFCCFNNGYKILPEIFDIWMRLLNQIDGSVLWLLADSPIAVENLRREAERRGVAGDRLVFAGRMPLPDHLARHRAADLFIDTLPYNAHTTASDALWAGLPVLTCQGESFAGRVASSLLTAVGLEDLITTRLDDYESRALHLATHPEALTGLRAKLAIARLESPLFKAAVFARHIEAAYLAVEARHRAGLEPDHIAIPA